MFGISILDIEKAQVIFRGIVNYCILPGEEGEFSILDFHQPIISCLKEGVVKVEKKKPISIRKGIAMMNENELVILVER